MSDYTYVLTKNYKHIFHHIYTYVFSKNKLKWTKKSPLLTSLIFTNNMFQGNPNMHICENQLINAIKKLTVLTLGISVSSMCSFQYKIKNHFNVK